ncbi:chemotaxis protein CheA [Vulcanibacillus modesticaldus]|uniref:Chemotaxis protein CheA n=1 Tax=Vulcanibacillus modesticaldus TaxID=337097 RepID=A0A1D2YXB3_9BACI|nr:chemotaxis protein CheA [Vulcanibacillus modesticaldus]OEG00421.1 chemotaxis protein CheA [Vulcanibacillus modesticaldus]
MDMSQYLDIFLDEAKEHLQNLNEQMLLLERDINNLDIVNEIFRSAHTLKGTSATMGFNNMATLTHEMENLLDLVRNHKMKVDSRIIDTIFSSLDILDQMVISISNGGDDSLDATEMINSLRSISSGESAEGKDQNSSSALGNGREDFLFDEYDRTILKQSIESGYSVYKILVTIEAETILKSARAFMVFHELEKYGEIIKANPPVEDLEKEDFGDHFSIILISKNQLEQVKEAVMSISEILDVNISTVTKKDLELETEDSKDIKKIEEKSQNNNSTKIQANKVSGKMVRVDIERLDELMNLFSELVIDKGRLDALANDLRNPILTDIVEHMSRISSSLQTNILNLRMVPIEQVFNRFPRMIRDLSKELNKKVNLSIIGADTELDRTVIDEIGDPLVHILRNAVDHGLESVEDRVKNNKPETGEIILKAYHSGNFIFIEITDDGKGINREKVINKAIEKGLITPESTINLTEKQVYELLLKPGFSTAERVSDISGRGVGLDVVKSKIESLGGFISIDSKLGKGTTFTIQLPLTLSIISSMLVQVQEEKYAIPLSSIIETAIVKKDEILYVQNQEVINFRGKIVPLVSLKKVFDVPNSTNDDSDEVAIVLVRKREKVAGLVVDSFIGQQEIVLKSLGTYLSQVFAISGATILGDGQVALILDTNALIK